MTPLSHDIITPEERPMTTTSADATPIFADVRRMHRAALDRLAVGDIRDAAEKAWCAAKRATDGLVLARTGQLPPKSPDTTRSLLKLARNNPEISSLRDRYFTRQSALHGDCFYTGWCEPVEAIELLIHETEDFIQDAETLSRA